MSQQQGAAGYGCDCDQMGRVGRNSDSCNGTPEELSARYAQPFLDKAAKYIDYLSIRSEAAVAAKSGVAAMHDLSEGGVFGALWELGQCSGVGLEIDLKKIPIVRKP